MRYLENLGKFKKYFGMRAGKVLPLPKSCIFEITTRCNLRCPMCYYKTLFNQEELNLKEIRFIIEKRFAGIIKNIYLIGAEPFMKPHLDEILRIFTDNGISVSVQTNGTLIIKMKKLLPYFKRVDLSIDGLKKTHNKIRGKGTFEKSIEGLKMLTEMDKMGIVSITLQKKNLSEVKDLIYFLADKGVQNIDISFLMWGNQKDIDKSAKMLNVSSKQIIPLPSTPPHYNNNIIKEIGELNTGIKISFSPDFIRHYTEDFLKGKIREKLRLTCSALYNLRIDPQGNIIPCPFIRKNLGNLLIQDIASAWNYSEFRIFRKNLLSNNLYPVCKRCCRADKLY